MSLRKIHPPVAPSLTCFSEAQFSFLNPKQDLVKIKAGTKKSFLMNKKILVIQGRNKEGTETFWCLKTSL